MKHGPNDQLQIIIPSQKQTPISGQFVRAEQITLRDQKVKVGGTPLGELFKLSLPMEAR